ncbi:MAG: hypothetical protein ACTHZ9_09255, partial [Leucobacter sp.]
HGAAARRYDIMRGVVRAALALAAVTAVAFGVGAPAQAAPVDPVPVADAAQDWDPEAWLVEQWPRLPFGDRATLEVADLSEGRELPSGSHQHLAGFVSVDRPDVVQLDREFVTGVSYEDRRKLLALSVHELSHAAIFQDGGVPPREDFEITEEDRDWAWPLLDTGLRGQFLALEAIAACIEQSALPPGTAVHYLSAACPTEYRDAAFDYLQQITGTDWRPQEVKIEDRAFPSPWLLL